MMGLLSVLQTTMVFIIVLGILVFVHELGHFLMAKLVGVKVERFSLGFPPKAVGKKVGETEYVLSWVPLGGYVKMLGENPDEVEGVASEERHRSFSHKPAWARFLITFAGPAFNAILTVIIFWAAFFIMGIPDEGSGIGQVMSDMPAAEVGIKPGDRIVNIDGQPIEYFREIRNIVHKNEGQTHQITLDRQGREITVEVKPKLVQVDPEKDIKVPLIGISPMTSRVGVFESLKLGLEKTYWWTRLILHFLFRLFTGQMSMAEVKANLGGPLTIAVMAGQEAQAGMERLINLIAFLSINLAIINLLPIPVLDGGHIFFLFLEMIFRKPISLNIRARAQQVGIVFLILFMGFVIFNDFLRFFTPSSPPAQQTQTQNE
jgi:regulator of sigma E protease